MIVPEVAPLSCGDLEARLDAVLVLIPSANPELLDVGYDIVACDLLEALKHTSPNTDSSEDDR